MSDSLLDELHSNASDYFDRGVWNNVTDIALTCLVALASLAAAGLAAANLSQELRWVTVVVAALPAAIISIQGRLRIRELSTWYFRYSTALRALERELRYATAPDIDDIIERRSKIDDEFENLWFALKTRPDQSETTKRIAFGPNKGRTTRTKESP